MPSRTTTILRKTVTPGVLAASLMLLASAPNASAAVYAGRSGDALYVVTDWNADVVWIERGGRPSDVVVSGLSYSGARMLIGYFGGVWDVFAYGNGDDTFIVGNLDIPGVLSIAGGAGDEETYFHGSDVNADVVIEDDAGDNTVSYGSATFHGTVAIRLGGGRDWVTGSSTTFFGTLHIDTGAGNDIVRFNDFWELKDDGSDSGNTYRHGVNINLGAGDDSYVERRGAYQARLYADGGSGYDHFLATSNDYDGGSPRLRNFELIGLPRER